jgi:carbamate kinase
MTPERLEYLNKLQKQLNTTREELNEIKNQKCEWIVFTHGNGSSRSVVTTNASDIEEVKQLLEKRHLERIVTLENEFKNM